MNASIGCSKNQVERTPDAASLKFGDSEMTYAELNARANRIAHALIDAGVTPRTIGRDLRRSLS